MNKIVKISAPGKLMLFGEHSVVYGRPCIVTAVDQRINAVVAVTNTDAIVLNAPDVGIRGFTIKIAALSGKDFPKEVKFVLTAVRNFFARYKVNSGLIISTKSSFKSTFGFGSSSAVTVCITMALCKLFDIEVNKKEVFDLCYRTILDVQGVGSGFDIASAIWGGTIYFVRGGKVIKPIKTRGLPLVVGYTGIKADTVTLVRKVAELHRVQKTRIDDIFDSIEKIVDKAKAALDASNYSELGSLMNANQIFLSELGVNIKELDKLIGAARKGGALGAKLSGAGGGDCMIAIPRNKARIAVEKQISKEGGILIHVKTGAKGVRIEKA